ncbi:MAG: ATP-binding domain-containing protein, partial [Propionibacteriaceae bacterium]|nr:ATP-binding domain-containing protein [Propionibacteriaceae bacterium]
EAGAVLADISQAPDLVTSASGPAVVQLGGNHRSVGDVARLADAIRDGDAEACLALLVHSDSCSLTPFSGTETLAELPQLAHDLEEAAQQAVTAANIGDGDLAVAALEGHRLLCAHREGPFGTGFWQAQVRRHLAATLPGYAAGPGHYPGQPLIVTRNSDVVSNGDVAVIIRAGDRLVAAVDRGDHAQPLSPLQLDATQELHAMTIHKSQGSQFDTVSVVLPPLGSPLLTRELLYTAITRAKTSVRLYGSPEALREAATTRARRASGLSRSVNNDHGAGRGR